MGVRNASKAAVWSKRITAFEASGQSRRAWCAAQGVGVRALDYWRRQLRDPLRVALPKATPRLSSAHARSSQAHAVALVPVLLRDAAPAPSTSAIELEWPSGLKLRTTLGTNGAELGALVRALSSC